MQAWNRLWRGQDMDADGKTVWAGPSPAFSSIAWSGFCAHQCNLEGWPRERHGGSDIGRVPGTSARGNQVPALGNAAMGP